VRTGPHFDGLYIIAQKRRMNGTFRIEVRAQTKDYLIYSSSKGILMFKKFHQVKSSGIQKLIVLVDG
jgi:hypothetical protein